MLFFVAGFSNIVFLARCEPQEGYDFRIHMNEMKLAVLLNLSLHTVEALCLLESEKNFCLRLGFPL